MIRDYGLNVFLLSTGPHSGIISTVYPSNLSHVDGSGNGTLDIAITASEITISDFSVDSVTASTDMYADTGTIVPFTEYPRNGTPDSSSIETNCQCRVTTQFRDRRTDEETGLLQTAMDYPTLHGRFTAISDYPSGREPHRVTPPACISRSQRTRPLMKWLWEDRGPVLSCQFEAKAWPWISGIRIIRVDPARACETEIVNETIVTSEKLYGSVGLIRSTTEGEWSLTVIQVEDKWCPTIDRRRVAVYFRWELRTVSVNDLYRCELRMLNGNGRGQVIRQRLKPEADSRTWQLGIWAWVFWVVMVVCIISSLWLIGHGCWVCLLWRRQKFDEDEQRCLVKHDTVSYD
ncbi:t22.7 [Tupaiid betaherpesvirus 1]|uniref:T22.7 n=1 Tax=Tupaiid herpesvirus 1 (strain 1) TaxID=10397 RepID=Q91TT2_TUHV1|nr:t22.7 [Tupaiid betaherpesvirus 1]AAK57055.1 t22.7 [Tupaiid betaherpesvirus 1]